MGDARSRQLRLERKPRGRRERRRAGTDGAKGSAAELKCVVRFVLSPTGHEPDLDLLAKVPSTLMSDALVELMEPYIFWPPAPDELDALEAWLQLGADVWNVTVEVKDGTACALELARLAADLDDEDPFSLLQEIARRKLTRFAGDRRRVAAVRVVAKDGWATVEAASLAYVSRASR